MLLGCVVNICVSEGYVDMVEAGDDGELVDEGCAVTDVVLVVSFVLFLEVSKMNKDVVWNLEPEYVSCEILGKDVGELEVLEIKFDVRGVECCRVSETGVVDNGVVFELIEEARSLVYRHREYSCVTKCVSVSCWII